MTSSNQIIGKVVSLQGQVIVRKADGSQEQLKVGDEIHKNDVIVTSSDGRVELSFDQGRILELKESDVLTVDASVYAPAQTDAANAALLPANSPSDTSINNAIIGRDSLDQLLEETAAGINGGDAGDGSSFVRLGRIAEAVTPQTYLGGSLDRDFKVPLDGANGAYSGPAKVENVSNPTVTEGGNLDFTITLSNPSSTTTDLTINTGGGTATTGTDTRPPLVSVDGGATFVPLTPTVVVPIGVTNIIVRIPTIDDGIIDGNETIKITASTPVNEGVPIIGTGTIVDAPVPSISISGAPDVNEAAGTVTYTVTLSKTSVAPITVNFGTANGTATAGSDYTAKAGTISFAPGETSKTFTVAINNDTVFEGAENLKVNLSSPTNATIGSGTVTTTIHDDGTGTGGKDNDSPIVSNVSSPSVIEGGNLDFTVTLSNPSTTPTTLNITPSSGTATIGTDTKPPLVSVDGGTTFVPLTPNLSVPPGVTSVIVRVPTVIDGIEEGNEAITLTASTPNNVGTVSNTGTIIDGALPTISISGQPDVNEAAGTVTYTVKLSEASVAPITVNYATANGTAIAGSDYTAAAGKISFAPGETSKTFTVAINNDTVFEGSENFKVNLSVPTNAKIATGSVTTTIHDDGTGTGGNDNDTPTVSAVSNPTVGEGGNLDFTVTLSNSSTTGTPLKLTPVSGTATLGTDTTNPPLVSVDGGTNFVPLTPSFSVPAGVTSVIVRVPTIDDGILEGTEKISLEASTNANPTPVTGIATITDGPVPSISISGTPDVNEGAGTVTYTVTLSRASVAPITVNYATENGTATAGSDYTTATGSMSFAPGETSKTFTVAINNDPVFEGAENFKVNLSSPTNATIGNGTFTTTIRDDGTGTGTGPDGKDDDRPVVSNVSTPSVSEGGNLDFTVTLSNPSTTPTTLNLTPSSGTATIGTDTKPPLVSLDGGTTFVPLTPTISVPPGVTSVIVRVPTVIDGIGEGNETITLTANTPNNTGVVTSTGTIIDGVLPSVSISGEPEVNEGAGTATYTVTLSSASVAPITVNYATADGTAKAGSDYTAAAGTVSFAPGETTKTFTVAIINDPDNPVFEGPESFIVKLGSPTNATLGTDSITTIIKDDGTGTGGNDNDTPIVSISGSPDINEGAGTVTYTVTLTGTSLVPISVNYGTANGTATAGSDYTATTGTLTFAPGETSKTFTVAISNDPVFEGAENFTVNLNTPTNARIGTGTFTTTIHDDGTGTGVGVGVPKDDDTPKVSNISSPSAPEGGNLDFVVTISNASTTPTPLTLTPTSGTATIGTDTNPPLVSVDGGVTFVPLTPTVSVPPGVTSVIVRVPTVIDGILEGNETITLTAKTPNNVDVVTNTGTIIDGAVPSLSISDAQADENAGTMTFTVTLSTPSIQPITVGYNTSDVTATAGADYTPTSGVLTFPPGVTQQTITVPILRDTRAEPDETFNIKLTTPTNATISDDTGIGTIRNLDTTPTLDLDNNNSSTPGTGYVTSFTENGPPVSISDVDIAITDPDSPNITGAKITITNLQPGDTLNLGSLPPGITAWSTVPGVLNLTGAGTLNDYQTAIHNITFKNTSDNPSTVPRTITVVVNDGSSDSNISTTTINVNPANDAPVARDDSNSVTEDAASTTLTVNAQDGVIQSANTSAGKDTDVDSSTLTVSAIRTGAEAGTGNAGAIGTALAGTFGTVTLNADGSYTYVLNNASAEVQNLRAGEIVKDIFTYTISDGQGGIDQATLTINVVGAQDLHGGPPILTTLTNPASGLNGEYYGYNDTATGDKNLRTHSDDGQATFGIHKAAGNLNSVEDIYQIIDGRNGTGIVGTSKSVTNNAADVRFNATNIDYGYDGQVNASLGSNKNIAAGTRIPTGDGDPWSSKTALSNFLDGDHSSAIAQVGGLNSKGTSGLGYTTDAAIRISGQFYVPPGTYDFRISGDDGYRLQIAGQTLIEHDGNQAPTTRIFTGVPLGDVQGGLQAIELLYWEQGENARLKIEYKASNDPASSYQVMSLSNTAMFTNESAPQIDDTRIQDLVFDGTWKLRTGSKLDGDAASNTITGNDGRDYLTGGGGDDLMSGGAGADYLEGGAGSDILKGESGNDLLIGGSGSDTLIGGKGDDIYRLSGKLDTIVENANEGYDTVQLDSTYVNANAGSTYTLGSNLENLNAAEGAAINLTGNSANNRIEGNSANNHINGGDGNDYIAGGGGHDKLTGGGGSDTFAWHFADSGTAGSPAIDTIVDFNYGGGYNNIDNGNGAAIGGGDVLDLRDLLCGEHTSSGDFKNSAPQVEISNLLNFIDVEVSGNDTIMHISKNGGFENGKFNSGAEDQRIVFQDVNLYSTVGIASGNETLLLQTLIKNGTLIVD